MANDGFFEVPLPTYSRSACSPELPEGFIGLAIRLPDVVDLGAQDAVPICGSYRLPASVFKELGGAPIVRTVVTFVDQQTHEPFSFNLRADKDRVEKDRPEPRESGPQLSESEVEVAKDFNYSLFFNVDALVLYPAFPRVGRRYLVYAVVHKFKSNAVALEVRN